MKLGKQLELYQTSKSMIEDKHLRNSVLTWVQSPVMKKLPSKHEALWSILSNPSPDIHAKEGNINVTRELSRLMHVSSKAS